jgi:hypothetical protein
MSVASNASQQVIGLPAGAVWLCLIVQLTYSGNVTPSNERAEARVHFDSLRDLLVDELAVTFAGSEHRLHTSQ